MESAKNCQQKSTCNLLYSLLKVDTQKMQWYFTKEYEYLTEEDDDIPWQCLLCDIDEMVPKFSFRGLSFQK